MHRTILDVDIVVSNPVEIRASHVIGFCIGTSVGACPCPAYIVHKYIRGLGSMLDGVGAWCRMKRMQ